MLGSLIVKTLEKNLFRALDLSLCDVEAYLICFQLLDVSSFYSLLDVVSN